MRTKRKGHSLWMVVCLLLLACSHSDPSLPFDPNIKDLDMAQLITGDDAIKAINKLHGMPIHVVRGFVVHYDGLYGEATVWASEATSEELAKGQIEVMMDKMKMNKRSPFSHYRSWDAKGMRVMAFEGMGQDHYVFRDQRWVYWLSADRRCIDRIWEHIHKTR